MKSVYKIIVERTKRLVERGFLFFSFKRSHSLETKFSILKEYRLPNIGFPNRDPG